MSALRSPGSSALVALAVAIAGAGCAGEPEPGPTVAELTARPFEEAVREPEPPASVPSPSPSPSPTPPPSPSPSPSPTPTGPSEADKARYAAAHQPDGAKGIQHVAVDLDADGSEELLFTFVLDQRSQVEIAAWDGSSYRVVANGTGGKAQRIDRVRVGDIDVDGRTEIVTMEAHEGGSSLTVFAVAGVDSLVGQRGAGGCYDGSATYGVVGADLRDTDGDAVPEIVARCDESPLPVSAWSEEVYRWVDGAYRVVDDPLPSPGSGGDDGDDGDDEDDEDDGHPGRGRGRP